MDELKIDKWKQDFTAKVQTLQTEYNAFFQSQSLDDLYEMEEVEDNQNLSLKILNREKLPKEMIDRLLQILIETKPEDSI